MSTTDHDGNARQQAENHVQHAEVQMLQAGMAAGPERQALLAEAKDALIRAERLAPGSGAWKLACIHAWAENADLCRQWLERARNAGTLPRADEIAGDPHFAKVRDKKWLKPFLSDKG